MRFEIVVERAQRGEVAFAGVPGRMRAGVVELAAVGGTSQPGKAQRTQARVRKRRSRSGGV